MQPSQFDLQCHTVSCDLICNVYAFSWRCNTVVGFTTRWWYFDHFKPISLTLWNNILLESGPVFGFSKIKWYHNRGRAPLAAASNSLVKLTYRSSLQRVQFSSHLSQQQTQFVANDMNLLFGLYAVLSGGLQEELRDVLQGRDLPLPTAQFLLQSLQRECEQCLTYRQNLLIQPLRIDQTAA